jgi:hypothetical protein
MAADESLAGPCEAGGDSPCQYDTCSAPQSTTAMDGQKAGAGAIAFARPGLPTVGAATAVATVNEMFKDLCRLVHNATHRM